MINKVLSNVVTTGTGVTDDDGVLGNVGEGSDVDEVDVCEGVLEVVCGVLVVADGEVVVGDEEVVVDDKVVVVDDEAVVVSDEEVVGDELAVLLVVVVD